MGLLGEYSTGGPASGLDGTGVRMSSSASAAAKFSASCTGSSGSRTSSLGTITDSADSAGFSPWARAASSA